MLNLRRFTRATVLDSIGPVRVRWAEAIMRRPTAVRQTLGALSEERISSGRAAHAQNVVKRWLDLVDTVAAARGR